MGDKKKVMRPVKCCANCESCYAITGPGEPHSYYCQLNSKKPEVTVEHFEWLKYEDTLVEHAKSLKERYGDEIEKECDWLCENRIDDEFQICQYYTESERFRKKLENAII